MTWRRNSECLNEDTNLYYEAFDSLDDLSNLDDLDDYNQELAREVDAICLTCPIQKRCFAEGVSHLEWGVWGGIYFEEGVVSERYNKHKTPEDWATMWSSITMEMEK